MTTLKLLLPEPLNRFVSGQARSEGFAGADEYILALIRQAQQVKEQAGLEAKLLAGVASLDRGEGTPFRTEFWDRLRAQIHGKKRKSAKP